MKLIFVRHGEPDYKNDCLTETGILQAKATAVRLKDEKISAIYSSPMGRAQKTASFTAEDHGLPIQTLDYMHEIDWGDRVEGADIPWHGHPWMLSDWLLSEHPEYVGSEKWKEHPYFRDNICMDYYNMIAEKFDEFLAGFGLIRKDGLYFCERPCDETVALFAHGGSGGCMFSHVLNLPMPFTFSQLPYGFCSVSVFDFSPKENGMVLPRLELLNDVSHTLLSGAGKLYFEK